VRNSLKKVVIVFGTRPEAIKLAPVIRALRRKRSVFACKVCVTAQHREMLDDVLRVFRIKPDYDLDVMHPGQTLAQVTSRSVEALDRVYEREKPDLVIVQGDTTTTFCGALVAFYRRIKVAHVEAGLRTHNRYAPFPEEINRTMVTHLADYHFAPTEVAKQNLLAEGIAEHSILVTGNTVVDALLWMRQRVRRRPPGLPPQLETALNGKRLVLVTGHRRESFGKGLEQICLAIRRIAASHPNVCIVYPAHLNPNVQNPVRRILHNCSSVLLLKPQPYDVFVWLMDRADIILTDSGGIQEEAPSLGKPVVVLREVTERPEAVSAGTARLVGTDSGEILSAVEELLQDGSAAARTSMAANPFGDGKATGRILTACDRFLNGNAEGS